MIKLGLIGYPLGHSLSPTLHEAALRSCVLEGSYTLFPIPPDDKQGIKDLLARVRNGEITGLNVTIPHKQNVIDLLDELSPVAKAIGAVNTIYRRESRLIGENTDAPGFLADSSRFLTTETRRHGNLEALVLGAGGSSRGIVYALVNDGWDVTLAARRMEQAEQLATSFPQYKLSITNYPFSNIDLSNIKLIVNTTPIGMTPNVEQSPWPENLPFPPHAAIYDLVYNPRETRFVRDACAQGLRATTGLGMLIEQAALAFEIWTGHRPSREIMFDAVNHTVH
jgi:shikimate dehydrogenase